MRYQPNIPGEIQSKQRTERELCQFAFLQVRPAAGMRMPISQETRAALDLLKAVQAKVAATDDLKNNSQVEREVLQ